MNIYESGVWVNKHLDTYGNGIKVNSCLLKSFLTIFILCTPFTAWMFTFMHKIKGVWLRW